MTDGNYDEWYSDFACRQVVDEKTVPAVEHLAHDGDRPEKRKEV